MSTTHFKLKWAQQSHENYVKIRMCMNQLKSTLRRSLASMA